MLRGVSSIVGVVHAVDEGQRHLVHVEALVRHVLAVLVLRTAAKAELGMVSRGALLQSSEVVSAAKLLKKLRPSAPPR